jgi:hypothetical protein
MTVAIRRPLRLALTSLWIAGALLAAVTAVMATRRDAGGVGGYAGAAVALALMALFTTRGHRLITTIGLVICALQPIAVAATAWELTHDISHTQVHKLQQLGVNPRLGVAINLVFCACASVLAVWAYRTRQPPTGHRR